MKSHVVNHDPMTWDDELGLITEQNTLSPSKRLCHHDQELLIHFIWFALGYLSTSQS